MDYDLERMAAEAGVRVNKVLAAIEPTDSLESELYAIVYPVVQAYYAQAISAISAQWIVNQLTEVLVQSIIDSGLQYGRRALLIAEPKVDDWTRRVERWHRTRWVGVVKGAVRLDITPILGYGAVQKQVEAATKRNVSLIRGLAADVEKNITGMVWTAYQDGTTNRKLAKQLRESIGFAPARARLIARDQLAKYADALDGARFEEAGLDDYIWKTVGDDHVRPTHKANNGKRFKNNKPPPVTGHPGHDINCRCKRRAIIYTEAEITANPELAAA